MEDPSLCALVVAINLNCEIHLFLLWHCVFLIREISVSASIASSCFAPRMFFFDFLFIFSECCVRCSLDETLTFGLSVHLTAFGFLRNFHIIPMKFAF